MPANVVPTPHLRRIGGVVTVGAVAAILGATLFPASGGEAVGSHFCLVCGTGGGVDVILNILLFAPLGVGLALYGVPARRAILMMLAMSALIETAQLWIPGRDSTLGDVVSNTVGGAAGFACSRYARIWLWPSPGKATFLLAGWSAIWLAIQVVSSFAFTASIPESGYYGQIRPVLGHFTVFRGQVIAAEVGPTVIPNAFIADGRALRHQLLGGATISVAVVPAEPTADVAPIVRVADTNLDEVLLIAQNGVDLVFAIRSAADAMRLRPPSFVLRDVFPGSDSARRTRADTISLTAQHASSGATLTAQSGATTTRGLVRVTTSLGWTLLLPWQWYISGSRLEQALTWLWIFSLVVPLGYWAGSAAPPAGKEPGEIRRPLLVASLFVVGYGGLGWTPTFFGLAATPFVQWLALIAGILAGAALAHWMDRISLVAGSQHS